MNVRGLGKNPLRRGSWWSWGQAKFLPLALHCTHKTEHIHTHTHIHIPVHTCAHMYVHTHRVRFLVSPSMSMQCFIVPPGMCLQPQLKSYSTPPIHSRHSILSWTRTLTLPVVWALRKKVSCFVFWKEMQTKHCHLASLKLSIMFFMQQSFWFCFYSEHTLLWLSPPPLTTAPRDVRKTSVWAWWPGWNVTDNRWPSWQATGFVVLSKVCSVSFLYSVASSYPLRLPRVPWLFRWS